MNQEEIEELLGSSESEGVKTVSKRDHNNDYDDDFENANQPVGTTSQLQESNNYSETFQHQEEIGEAANNDVEEEIVESQYGSQNFDDFHEDARSRKQNAQNDDDLSEVKSEFIESSKFNKAIKTKQTGKQVATNKASKDKKQTKRPSTSKDVSQQSKNLLGNLGKHNKLLENVVKKYTDEEINDKMKKIHQEKAQRDKKLQKEKDKKQEQRKREYEEAKKKEQQRKEQNKQILEEQKKKKQEPKKPQQSNKSIKEEEIEMPIKPTVFAYMGMKAEKKKKEKDMKKVIEEDNKVKLKELRQEAKKETGEEKKALFLAEKNILKKNIVQAKQKQGKEEDTVQMKLLRKEIAQITKENQQKKKQIHRAQDSINTLKKRLKEKEKIFHKGNHSNKKNEENFVPVSYSQLSPIERFVYAFPQCQNSEQIFRKIDDNQDNFLSVEEIRLKLFQLKLDSEIAQKVYDILDENSDGNVSLSEFTFIIETELQRQKDYRAIMGEVKIADPLDLEAKILDMRSKISYMNKKIEQGKASSQTEDPYEAKYQKLLAKIKKMEFQMKRQGEVVNTQNKNSQGALEHNKTNILSQAVARLQSEKEMQSILLQKIKQKYNTNIKDKNMMLSIKVEESLHLREETYRVMNEVQELQLRFLSVKKIEENKKGYLQRQGEKYRELEEIHKVSKQYQVGILDPTKKLVNNTYMEDIKFLAAVIMIQRNFKKKKAMKELKAKKQQHTN